VGDWVTYPNGSNQILVQIIEDRGRLGVGGRRLYRVRLDREALEPDMFEIREEFLQAAGPDKNGRRG
jgi:hypothetical protein